MGYIVQICGKELDVDNKVGLALIRQFEQRFPDDKGYVLGKAENIENMDIASCLLQWFNLDADGRALFSEKLGMPTGLLQQTCEGIKWIANN